MGLSAILPKVPEARWGRIATLVARRWWIAPVIVSAALLLLPFACKLDGHTHADWQQFLGRFHPLAVHLPIGLVLLVPVLEIVGRFRPSRREAAGFVLTLGVFACVGAVLLGYLLAYGSGTAGGIVTRHMWGGILLTEGVLLCACVRPYWANNKGGQYPKLLSAMYPCCLTLVLILLGWAAHLGGTLTHGSGYLTQYMPPPLKNLFLFTPGIAGSEQLSDSFYTKHIHLILEDNCAACHGEGKVKGGLRVDTYELLMRGGKDGPVIVAGNPERSLLLSRVTLPSNHKLFMPAEGKPPLNAEQIAWLRAWIAQGASPSMQSLAGIESPEDSREPALPPVGDYSSLMPRIEQMSRSYGAKLMQVSKNPGDGLILNTVDAGVSFDDQQIKQFTIFAPFIVEAELGRTSITDNCFDTLKQFTHLRVLHLEDTSITGSGLVQLSDLSELHYLNLTGTQVTSSAVAPLQAMKNLRHLYLYNTPARPQPLAAAIADKRSPS